MIQDEDGFGPANIAELGNVSRETLERIECVIPVSYTHLTLPTTPYV